ncbi:MAG: ThuA domain-containing protein [Thermoguttaceae bacterium]|jgi:type 1 glutamine amidotransferase
MRSTFLVLLTLAFAVSPFVAATAQGPAKTDKPVRVLIVTGVDYVGHLWKETAPAVQKVLERNKRIEARIVEDPEFLAAPAVSDYDVIFLHFKNYQPFSREKEIRENLAKLVKQGKGLVAIHLACGAFEDWPEYANLAGKVLDKTSAHDPRGPFQVRIIDKDHPLTCGMQDFQADDELYRCLVDGRPVQLLATARSKITGKDYPMAFAFEYGKGRVFHTPLGHDVRAIEIPGTAELLRRGCLWAAGRKP